MSFPKGKSYASALRQIHVLPNKKLLYAANSAKGKKVYELIIDSNYTEKELNNLAINEKYNNWAAYTGNFAANVSKDKMVYAYKYFHQIRFMNLKGDKVKQLVFDNKEAKPGKTTDMLSPTNTTYYWKMSQTKENIYLSYSGRTPIEVKNDFKKGKDYIYIDEFDWYGNPKRKFKLNRWGYFCIDEKRNKLYLVATNAEEPFYVYDLAN